ncbi:MAG: hypothetical protein CL920_23275 [Deltaproteobacteria bacterium]|nr:hypothetical protein [Deltaproteobacteria bacterium]MBU51622.1 hypothetical protein [Deltaproteobacteria bacterium]
MQLKKRYIALIIILLLIALLAGSCIFLSHPKPDGVPGPKADALAKRIQQQMNLKAWRDTGAIQWIFSGRNRHIWDKKRNFSIVRWGSGHSEVKAVFSIPSYKKGVVYQGNKKVNDPEKRQKLLKKAYAAWINDSFWLNPIAKFFDKGTTRRLVTNKDGSNSLLVEYKSGGLTPGDAYLYEQGANGLPKRWRMWVSNIPIRGLAATFSGWETLSTGVKISTSHDIGFFVLKLSDVKAAKDIRNLLGKDPFTELVAKKNAAQPTSKRTPSPKPTTPKPTTPKPTTPR